MVHSFALIEIKVILRVVITNVLHYLARPYDIVWQLAVFDIIAKQVANQPAEILVPWER
jgi:hypothetical protein